MSSHTERMLKEQGQNVKVIVSGDGEHMYVDCIPRSAGKLSSLVHVQKKYRIPLDRTVACGDSGESLFQE